jgi:hypothetical protein
MASGERVECFSFLSISESRKRATVDASMRREGYKSRELGRGGGWDNWTIAPADLLYPEALKGL